MVDRGQAACNRVAVAESIVALALVGIGIGGYLATGRKSRTALIPALFGVVVALLLVAAQLSLAAGSGIGTAILVVVCLGLVATYRGISACVTAALKKRSPGAAAVSKGAMALTCGAYLVSHLVLG